MTKLVELHNDARSKYSWIWNINSLSIDEKLMSYAQQRALYMAENGTMQHSNIKDIMKLGFSKSGENIAYGQKDEASVMKTWLWSVGHRANIMSTAYSKIGCGFSYDDNNHIYWCVCFGKSK